MRVPAAVLCLLLAGCGSSTLGAAPPDRLERDGQPVQRDGGAWVEALTQAGPTELVVHVFERRSDLPPQCRRYAEVVVVRETPTTVELAAHAYRPTWETEPPCPEPHPGDTATATVGLREPLGDRDVVDNPEGQPLHVQARTVPGRTPVRGTPSCAETAAARTNGSADYAHVLRHGGRTYVQVEGPEPVRGEPVGTVRCTLSGSLTPLFGYRWRDGDAAFLEAGSPYWAVQGRPVTEALAAEWDGRLRLFAHEPELDD